MSIYEFTVKNIKQQNVSLKDYQGKVLLIVNTATSCGYTPQYEGLEKLYKTYKSKGFEVLDFPCNQFLAQAKGSDESLAQFCQINYDTTFQTFAKLKVNGKDAHPLFQFLRNEIPVDYQKDDKKAQGLKGILQSLKPKSASGAIKWNFTKFLVDREGKVVYRFSPTFTPEEIDAFIKKII